MISPYLSLESRAKSRDWQWLMSLIRQAETTINNDAHGDLPGWLDVLEQLPAVEHHFDGSDAAPLFGRTLGDQPGLQEQLLKLHPWRKGPLNLGGLLIDTEWRSDWKWQRIAPHLDLAGHRVLDIGSGNGYYGWRMLANGADTVIGVDPTLVYTMQWLACRHFSGDRPNYVLPLGVEDLPENAGGFDSVFSMGVLYHRRDPVAHLKRLVSLLESGGQLVLETLILEADGNEELVPESRYARMRNVWAVPTLDRLEEWMGDAGLTAIRTLDINRTSTEEQRTTQWMRFESLANSLDPADPTLTVEGYPAPVRAALLATRPL